jgi:hypothetical protein
MLTRNRRDWNQLALRSFMFLSRPYTTGSTGRQGEKQQQYPQLFKSILLIVDTVARAINRMAISRTVSCFTKLGGARDRHTPA